MWSTRARLAAAYAGLLFATLVAFCIGIYFARESSANQELGQRAIASADAVIATIAAAERSGRKLTIRNDSGYVSSLPELRKTLEPLPGYFMVFDSLSRLLYSSFAVQQLPSDDKYALNQVAVDLNPGVAAVVTLPGDTILGGKMILVARSDPSIRPNISSVVAGYPSGDAEVPAQLLLGTLLLLAPLALLASVAIAYVLAGSTFKPVDQLINEVEAITDGRSLHRRVPTDEADEELSRLARRAQRRCYVDEALWIECALFGGAL